MIIVRISGGLGNQMFQHAAGLALARRHACELKWDLSWFENNRLHQGFELPRVFGLAVQEAVPADYHAVFGWRGAAFLRALWPRRPMNWARPRAWIREPHFHYWPGFLDLRPPVLLDGYWQSARYFEGIAPLVRQTYTFAPPLSPQNAELAAQITTCNAVSLHVRRGDYVADPVVSQVHGVCTQDYYERAVRFLMERVETPHFFVFSDEPEWAQANLDLPAPFTVIGHNRGAESYNDMRLMILCKHHIIANSSFSWWGAWLGTNPEKSVIAPRRWFKNYPADTSDLYCANWERV